MKKFFVAVIFFLCIGGIFPAVTSASWANLVYDQEVSLQTRQNIQRAVDTTADLLTKYKITLSQEVTVVVAADEASYVQALMFYAKIPREKAELMAKYTGGESLGNKPMIIMKGSPLLQNSVAEAFRVLPHELFHQVQRQYGHTQTVNWLVEGTPEVFQLVAREEAGLGKVTDNIRRAENVIHRAQAIPDARQLANYDYKTWDALMQQYPIYAMSVVMAYRLIQDNGFENVVFFYQLLHSGRSPDNAFVAAFRVPMAWFLSDMNAYFERLRSNQ